MKTKTSSSVNLFLFLDNKGTRFPKMTLLTRRVKISYDVIEKVMPTTTVHVSETCNTSTTDHKQVTILKE